MPDPDSRTLQYRLELSEGVTVQVGLAAMTTGHGEASWTSDDFFVPLSLWGAGLGTGFLRELLRWLETSQPNITRCVVRVKGPDVASADLTQWEERRGFVDFYRQAGFVIETVLAQDEAKGTGSWPRGPIAVLSQRLPRPAN